MITFLRLKHWQLFGLLVGVPFVFQFLMIVAVANNDISTFFFLLPLMMIVVLGVFFGWFYALGTNLHKKLPASSKMNLRKFKILFFIPIIYICVVSIFMTAMIAQTSSGGKPNPLIFALIIPMHLFSMFCIFYSMYFVSKSLKSVELQREVSFSDFAGEFFLIWFFPIGIWFLQPRINKLYKDSATSGEIKPF